MSEEIGNYIACALGKRKSGKTDYTLGNDEHNIPGFIDTYEQKGMKVLFVDMVDHVSYRHIPLITMDHIERWESGAGGVYRIFVTSKAEMRELKEVIRINIWNALIVWEDALRHERYKLSDEMMAMIGNSKQQNVDMIFQYHDPTFIPLDLYIYLDFIEVFKVEVLPGKRESKAMGAKYNSFLECCQRVNAHPSKYYHETLITTQ
jgi:hypothetical protein